MNTLQGQLPERLSRLRNWSAGRDTTSISVPVLFFLLAVVFPSSIIVQLGPISLNFYKFALLVLFPVVIVKAVQGVVRFQTPDYLVLGFSVLQGIVMTYHHGLLSPITVAGNGQMGVTTSGLETIGVTFLEISVPYLLARTFVRNPSQVRKIFQLLAITVPVIGLGALIESTSGYSLFTLSNIQLVAERNGLFRASGPFPHPILWGVFAASAFSLALCDAGSNRLTLKSCLLAVAVALSAYTSLSSGAILVIAVQVLLIGWLCVTRRISQRWTLFAAGFAALYIMIDILSNRTPLAVFLSYGTFSTISAFYRTLIWEFGWQNVMASPFFGIGLSDWVRAYWMTGSSVDAFWLLMLIRYGFLGAGPLFAGVLAALFSVGKSVAREPASLPLGVATSWMFSTIGVIIGGFTVHFWDNSLIYFIFMIGLWGAFKSAPIRRSRRNSAGK